MWKLCAEAFVIFRSYIKRDHSNYVFRMQRCNLFSKFDARFELNNFSAYYCIDLPLGEGEESWGKCPKPLTNLVLITVCLYAGRCMNLCSTFSEPVNSVCDIGSISLCRERVLGAASIQWRFL